MPTTLATPAHDEASLAHALTPHIQPLVHPDDEDALLHFLAQGRIVMLGQDTHSTHELHELPADPTRRFTAAHGFGPDMNQGDAPGLRPSKTSRGRSPPAIRS